jgi:hypothetical protein
VPGLRRQVAALSRNTGRSRPARGLSSVRTPSSEMSNIAKQGPLRAKQLEQDGTYRRLSWATDVHFANAQQSSRSVLFVCPVAVRREGSRSIRLIRETVSRSSVTHRCLPMSIRQSAMRKRPMSGVIRSNAGREAEWWRSDCHRDKSGSPLMRVGVCYCLGSGPVSHQGALRAREAENLPQLPRDVANSKSLCRSAYEGETVPGVVFRITPDCLHTAEVGGSIPPAPTAGIPCGTRDSGECRRRCLGPSVLPGRA